MAAPGNTFAFEGKIVSLDLRTHILSIMNNTDETLRELTVDQIDAAALQQLHEGAEVSIQALFDGHAYEARTIKVLTSVR